MAKICDYLGDARAEFVFDPRNPFVFTGWLDLENSLLELITNAVRFAPRREDGGFIRVWVEVETHRCKIHVQNNGPGLPKDPTHPDGYIPPLDPQRPGVGLALTRYTVQKMGGTLTEVGRENEDAHFIIDLALCEPPKTG